jgi:septal ring factor EnvC (AmiA/AmiB activator)
VKQRAATAILLAASIATTLPAPAAAPASPKLSSTASVIEFERVLGELDREERTLKKQLDELAGESDRARARTLARGRTYVRLIRAGLLPLGGGFEMVVDHASKVERLRRALGRDVALEEKLAARRIELSKRLGELRAQRGPLEAQHRALASARNVLLAARDRELAFDRAFSSSTGHTAIYGPGSPSDPSDTTSGFAAMKGRLPFPLPGRTEISSARRPGTDGQGLEMRAPLGTPVRAVFRGRVAYADDYPAYGRTVILEHGDGYYTVSANLDEISVEVGDEVQSGSRIGTVGDTGGGALLYLEVRGGPDMLDPAAWFGI